MRGGSFGAISKNTRCAHRNVLESTGRTPLVGFRVLHQIEHAPPGLGNDEIRPSFQSAGIVFNSNHGLGAMIFVPRPEATLVFEPPTLISFATSSTVAALPM